MEPDIDLHVHWDAPMDEELAFVPGEHLEGEVVLESDGSARCESLTVALRWRAHGAGDEDAGTTGRTELASDIGVEPGAQSFDFSLEAPPGPFSYRGELVFVDWCLRAVATVDSGTDELTEDSTFELRPGPTDAFTAGSAPPEELAGEPTGVGPGCTAGNLGLTGCVGLPPLLFCALLVGIPGFSEPSSDGVLFWGGLVGLIIGVFGIGARLRGMWLNRSFPDITYELDPQIVERGGRAHAAVDLDNPRELSLESVEFELRQWEFARVPTTGTSPTSTQRRQVRSEPFSLPDAAGSTLPADAAVELSRDISVPADAAPTFSARFNEVSWELVARISPESTPEQSATMPVVVRPERGG